MNKNYSLWLILLSLAELVPGRSPGQISIKPPYRTNYSLVDLGAVPGLPPRRGGLTFSADNHDVLLIGGNANSGLGFVHVPPGSPDFPNFKHILVSEYSSSTISTYEVDANGNPIASTCTPFITGLFGAEGAALDPLTGDVLFYRALLKR
jgi:hypothetical protein